MLTIFYVAITRLKNEHAYQHFLQPRRNLNNFIFYFILQPQNLLFFKQMIYYLQKQGGGRMTLKYVYTVTEVADILEVSTKTVYKMIQSGEIPALRVRGQIRITHTALQNYLDGGSK